MKYLLLIICFINSFSILGQVDYCKKTLWKNFHYVDDSNEEYAQIKLAYSNKGIELDKINKIILTKADHILSDYYYTELENKITQDSIYFYKKNKIFSDTVNGDLVFGNYRTRIETSIFCSNDIITYEITSNCIGDRGSPYVDVVNIKIKPTQLILYSDLIDERKKTKWTKLLDSIANNSKQKLIGEYLEVISKGFGDALYQRMLDFESKNYNYDLVEFTERDSIDYSDTIGSYYKSFRFNEKGIIINIWLKDQNYKSYAQGRTIEYLPVKVYVPYATLLPFVNENSIIYSSILKATKN